MPFPDRCLITLERILSRVKVMCHDGQMGYLLSALTAGEPGHIVVNDAQTCAEATMSLILP